MNRAQVLGKTFLFPEQQAATQVQRTPRASDALTPDKMNDYFGIPEPAEGLQYTGDMVGRVQNYYQGLAALQQFAREQWTRYGVDVTNPDPTRQDSVMAAQAYQAALANLRTEGDMLKESQAMLKQVMPVYAQREYEFAQDTFNQPFAQVAGTQAGGQSLRVDPLVAFTGQQAGKDFTSYGQFQQAQQAVQGLQQQPLSERDRVAAQAITPDYTPRAASGGSKTSGSVFEFLKRASAVAKGVSDYKISKNYIDPETGQALAETKEFNDAFESIDRKTGKEVKGVIQGVLRNPTTGAMYLKISNQSDLVPVSMTEFVYGISKANPKYPGVDKISSYIGEVGASDQAGNIVPEMFLEPKAIQSATQKEQQLQQEAANVEATWNQMMENFNMIEPSGGFSRFFGAAGGIEVDSKFGKLTIRKNKDGTFDVVNREVIPTDNNFTAEQRTKAFTNIAPDKLKQMVAKYNFSVPGLQPSQSQPTGRTVSVSTLQSKVGTPGFEGYTLEELIEYYRSQGYNIQ